MNDAINCANMDIGLPDFKNNIQTAAFLEDVSKMIKMNKCNTSINLADDEQLEFQNSADGIVSKKQECVTERLKMSYCCSYTVETSVKKVKIIQNLLGGEV
jgi:hypothetical protein